MGNVNAAASSKAAPPGVSVPPAPPSGATGSEPPMTGLSESSAKLLEILQSNPGSYDTLHNHSRNISPEQVFFEGGKLTVNKGLSQHFTVSHDVHLSTLGESGYTFSTQCLGDPPEGVPMFMGKINPNGNMMGICVGRIAGTSVQCQFQTKGSKWQDHNIDLKYQSKSYTVGLAGSGVNLINLTGATAASYVQRVTSRLTLAGLLVHMRDPQIPGGSQSKFNIAAKLSGDKWEASAEVSPLEMHALVFYSHKVTPEASVGVEFITHYMHADSTARLSYQMELPVTGTTFRASVDTKYNVMGVLEKNLGPNLPFKLSLCGVGNQQKSAYKFGIGLTVGGPGP